MYVRKYNRPLLLYAAMMKKLHEINLRAPITHTKLLLNVTNLVDLKHK